MTAKPCDDSSNKSQLLGSDQSTKVLPCMKVLIFQTKVKHPDKQIQTLCLLFRNTLRLLLLTASKFSYFVIFLYFQGTNFSYFGSIYYDFNDIHCY